TYRRREPAGSWPRSDERRSIASGPATRPIRRRGTAPELARTDWHRRKRRRGKTSHPAGRLRSSSWALASISPALVLPSGTVVLRGGIHPGDEPLTHRARQAVHGKAAGRLAAAVKAGD